MLLDRVPVPRQSGVAGLVGLPGLIAVDWSGWVPETVLLTSTVFNGRVASVPSVSSFASIGSRGLAAHGLEHAGTRVEVYFGAPHVPGWRGPDGGVRRWVSPEGAETNTCECVVWPWFKRRDARSSTEGAE